MKSVHTFTFVLLLCTSFASGQGGMQQSPTTPPTFPQGQQAPSNNPDQTPGRQQYPSTSPTENNPAGQTGTPAVSPAKAQNQIQDALRKQLPASADSVVVTVLNDNRIQLAGTVSTEQERHQIEQVARSAAPDQVIVNSITVANGSKPPGSTITGSATGETAQAATGNTAIQSSSQPANTQAGGGASPPPSSSSGAPTGTASQSSTLPYSSGTTMASLDVQNSIQTAITNDPNLSKSSVGVKVTDNKIELRGTVSSEDEKRAVQRIAESNAAGRKVINHLKVEKSKASSGPTQ